MNKKLRILLLTGLAALFCSSCSKMEEILPESYTRNDLPFSVEKVPVEGGTITLQKVVGESIVNLNPASTTQTFSVGDTLILTATAKSGYTFINWKRDGVEKTTQPEYKFCLEGKDVDENGRIKYHYEARFGLDYAIQRIPPIDEVMPAELIAEMGPYLHFGDNPPKIEFSFNVPKYHLFMDTLIQHDTTEEYGSNFSFPMLIQYNGHNAFVFEKQHRSVAEYHYYERENHPDVFYYYAYVEDSIFIMGHDDYFTAYFHQTWRTWGEHGIGIDYLLDVTRHESVILSGKVGNDGIEDFHWGMRVESYNPPDYSYIGADAGSGGQPGIKDILIFKSDTICPYFSEFQKHNFE